MSTHPCISYWFGRLGNNIQQISNAIYFCRLNRINFSLPPHDSIDHFRAELGKDAYLSSRFFFFNGNNPDFRCNEHRLNDERGQICREFILPNLRTKPAEPFDDGTLVLHVRSGDIFCVGHANKLYVQNPLWYYEELVARFDRAIVVTDTTNEARLNPVISCLRKNPKVTLQSSSVEHDFAVLLAAKHLASSGVGTFAVAAALCSRNITDFYCSTLYHWSHLNPTMLFNTNVSVHMTHVKNYTRVGAWTGTDEQIQLMLSHKKA